MTEARAGTPVGVQSGSCTVLSGNGNGPGEAARSWVPSGVEESPPLLGMQFVQLGGGSDLRGLFRISCQWLQGAEGGDGGCKGDVKQRLGEPRTR